MNKKAVLLYILVCCIIIGIILFTVFYKSQNLYNFGYNYSELAQPVLFYQQKRGDTLKYLLAVYPTAEESFNKLSDLDLACFYNSLWFYYNCEAAGSYTVSQDLCCTGDSFCPNIPKECASTPTKPFNICWSKLNGCGEDGMPKLPYTPQGWIYSFKKWIENWVPYYNSNSTDKPEEIAGGVPGETFWYPYTGPSPVWMYQRAIFRMIYKIDADGIPLKPCENVDAMCAIPSILPGNLENIKPYWNYPQQWWLGVRNYMEITAASEPGIPSSPPIVWYDGWVGSGNFLYLGKTKVARNKVNMLFELTSEMNSTTDGKNTLISWFGVSDPYDVIRALFIGQPPGYTTCNLKATIYPTFLSADGLSKKSCNICNLNNLNWVTVPSDNKGWVSPTVLNSRIYNADYVKICDENSLSNDCIDKMMYGGTYKADRFNVVECTDEPLFAIGQYLGYDTLQDTNSSNGTGWWQYEIMELRGYPDEVKKRDYSSFIQLLPTANCPVIDGNVPVQYISSFAIKHLNFLSQFISIRDPLDIYNEQKVKKCSFSYTPTSSNINTNITCDENMSRIFKNVSILAPFTAPGQGSKCNYDIIS